MGTFFEEHKEKKVKELQLKSECLLNYFLRREISSARGSWIETLLLKEIEND